MAAATSRYEAWLPETRIESLSRSLADPVPFAKSRHADYERFLRLPIEPNPLYRGYGYFTNVDLTGIDPLATGAPVPLPPMLPRSVRVVHDASGTRIELSPEARALGVRATALAEIWRSGDAEVGAFLRGIEEPADSLSALATTVLNRGYRLEIPDRYPEPLRIQEIVVLSVPHEALSVRRQIRAGEGTQLLATEEVFSTPQVPDGQRLYAALSDLDLADDAKAVYLTVHAPDQRTVSIYRRRANVGPRARLAWVWNGWGGFRTKVRNQTTFTGAGAKVDDLQTFFGEKVQSYDSAVDFTHVATDTHSQSITRGVFRDEARGMSRGLVRIEPEARKTVALVSEHAMLLSRGARSDSIPILEILCRDVKATHSSSVAPVDPEKVFYLESRGIPELESVRMIGEGFLAYVLDRVPIEGIRDLLYPHLAARWDGKALSWGPGPFPTLPALNVTGTDQAPEWRFDAKLR
ncbi:MAG TPA: SufD family Fe-S cluster assembly protein [Thermoplasmata archaeon]|nr:SufD family Fe-S cluster assembly protein [Thermoplasmata archaeon]